MQSLTFLQLNDLHGYLQPHAELFDLAHGDVLGVGGGLARIATIVQQVRRDAGGALIALDSGDTFHGTMAAVHTRGEALLEPMRALALDAMTIHWELAYGLSRAAELAEGLPYPILAANCGSRDGSLPFPPFTLVNRGGMKVAVIGLAAVAAEALLPRRERGRIRLTIGEQTLRALVPALRRDHGADLIVVLSHLGFPQDCKLAATVSGIDVVLSGHTHNRLDRPALVNGTLIMQSGAHGSFVGRLDVRVGRDGIADWTHALLPVSEAIEPDPDMQAIVDAELSAYAGARTNILAESAVILHRYAMLESTMDNLLLDATAAAAGTRVALTNGWRYGAPIPAGPLSEFDTWNIVPANPPVSRVTLTGGELRALLEDNIESTFACDPWQQRGGYLKRCRGIEMLLKLENPAGLRIHELTVGGDRVRDDLTYEVGFLGEQAVPAGVGTDRAHIGLASVEALCRYLRTEKAVAPTLRGAITLV